MLSGVIEDTVSSSSENSGSVDESNHFPRLYFDRKSSFKSSVKFVNLKFKTMRAENSRLSRKLPKTFQVNESVTRNKFSIDNILGQLKNDEDDGGSGDDVDLEHRDIVGEKEDECIKFDKGERLILKQYEANYVYYCTRNFSIPQRRVSVWKKDVALRKS